MHFHWRFFWISTQYARFWQLYVWHCIKSWQWYWPAAVDGLGWGRATGSKIGSARGNYKLGNYREHGNGMMTRFSWCRLLRHKLRCLNKILRTVERHLCWFLLLFPLQLSLSLSGDSDCTWEQWQTGGNGLGGGIFIWSDYGPELCHRFHFFTPHTYWYSYLCSCWLSIFGI